MVKIRIGVGLGAAGASDDFGAIVCDMEQCGFDSLWLSEVLTTPVIDPALTFPNGSGRRTVVSAWAPASICATDWRS